MAKRGQNKQNKSQQLTPEAYLRQRARSLEIGACYASDIFGEAGERNFEFSIAEGEEDESEKEEYMSPQSTTMMENLETYEMFHILDFAEMLHLDIPQKGTEKQIKKAYIQAIYDHPMQVMERLPLTEIALLASVKELDKGFRQVPLVNSLASPIFTVVGFAKRAELTDNTPYAIVADDFVEKVLVHLNFQQLLDSQQERYEVESLFRVASDLYGAVSEKHLKQLIAEHFDVSQQEASVRFDKAREQSALFDWISVNLQPFTQDEESIFYQSDYMWDDLQAFHKATAVRRSIKEFRALPKECLQNSEAIYEQLNDQRAGFAQFLKEQFGLDDAAVQDVCFNLWYRAQHEEDPDFEQESFMEYFINEVFERITPSKRSKSALEEAITYMQAYMNAMPRWVLKGHSPAEVDRGAM